MLGLLGLDQGERILLSRRSMGCVQTGNDLNFCSHEMPLGGACIFMHSAVLLCALLML